MVQSFLHPSLIFVILSLIPLALKRELTLMVSVFIITGSYTLFIKELMVWKKACLLKYLNSIGMVIFCIAIFYLRNMMLNCKICILIQMNSICMEQYPIGKNTLSLYGLS